MTVANIFLHCNLSDPIYSVGAMTGSENFEPILGVITTSFMKGTMNLIRMGFLVLRLRLLTINFWEKGSYRI